MSETNRIEYKRELTSELDIEKEVVAFLNYKEGGYIYIGIDKDGSTVGVNDVDDCMLRLKDRIKHNISPSAMGLPMPQEQIDRLFAMRTRNSIGRIVSNRQDFGIPRILRAYGEDCFKFTDNFIRITFPINAHTGTKSALSRHQDGTKLTMNIEDVDKLLIFCKEVRTIAEMLSYMNYSDRTKFRKKYIYPLLDAGIIQMTIPDKPNSRNQKYQLTAKGLELMEHLKSNK